MMKQNNYLVMGLLAAAIFACFYNVNAQIESDVPEELGSALLIFKPNPYDRLYYPEVAFSDFDYFELKKLPGEDIRNPRVDSDGRVMLLGVVKLKDGNTLEFEKAYLKRLKDGKYKYIVFETRKIGRLSYKFCGEFLDEAEPDPGGGHTVVRGTLIKLEDNKQSAKTEMPFQEWTFV